MSTRLCILCDICWWIIAILCFHSEAYAVGRSIKESGRWRLEDSEERNTSSGRNEMHSERSSSLLTHLLQAGNMCVLMNGGLVSPRPPCFEAPCQRAGAVGVLSNQPRSEDETKAWRSQCACVLLSGLESCWGKECAYCEDLGPILLSSVN